MLAVLAVLAAYLVRPLVGPAAAREKSVAEG
jgi:hypothetical protein